MTVTVQPCQCAARQCAQLRPTARPHPPRPRRSAALPPFEFDQPRLESHSTAPLQPRAPSLGRPEPAARRHAT